MATRNGFCFEAKKGFKDAGTYDALWVPGGDPAALARLMGGPNRTYLDFLIRLSKQTPWVCSVCEGALLLAAAGLLDGYEMTTHWAFVACIKERFPKVILVEGHPRYDAHAHAELDVGLDYVRVDCGEHDVRREPALREGLVGLRAPGEREVVGDDRMLHDRLERERPRAQ